MSLIERLIRVGDGAAKIAIFGRPSIDSASLLPTTHLPKSARNYLIVDKSYQFTCANAKGINQPASHSSKFDQIKTFPFRSTTKLTESKRQITRSIRSWFSDQTFKFLFLFNFNFSILIIMISWANGSLCSLAMSTPSALVPHRLLLSRCHALNRDGRTRNQYDPVDAGCIVHRNRWW